MRLFARKLRDLFRSRPRPSARRCAAPRLRVRALEDRLVPAAVTATGVLSGLAFVDSNGDGVHEAQEAVLPGVQVTLQGTATNGKAVDVSTTTDANGLFTFSAVFPGTYSLTGAPVPGLLGGSPAFGDVSGPSGVDVVPGLSVTGGKTLSQNLGYLGLDPHFASLRQLLTDTTAADFPFQAAGGGTAAGTTTPFLQTTIGNVTVAAGAAAQTIDLAGHFSDPGLANSQIQINTTDGPVNVTLFDAQAPQTVANFYDYINSGAYNNSIFHRVDNLGTSSPAIVQGGGFTFPADGQTPGTITVGPKITSEFSPARSNVAGTIAMALGSTATGATDPNSGTDEFFFNVQNNATQLDPQQFTVFGQVNGAADMQVLQKLANTPRPFATNAALNTSPFQEVPLQNFTGTNFPADVKQSNYVGVTGVKVINQPESLTYTVLSNTNSSVTATIKNEQLTLTFPTTLTAAATGVITVQATNQFGLTATASFTVTVNPPATTGGA